MLKKLIKHIKGVLRLSRRRKSLKKLSTVSMPSQDKNRRRERRGKNTQDQPAAQSPRPERKRQKPQPSSPSRKEPSERVPKAPVKPPLPPLLDIPAEEGKTRFCDLELSPEVLAGTQQAGFKYCSVIQEKCLPFALDGRDLAAKAQTGTGKTAAFLASAMTHLLKNPKKEGHRKTCRVLVLEPTRELALQIEKDAEQLGKYTGLVTKAIFGGMDYKMQRDSLDCQVDILAGTPGRIIDYSSGRYLDLSETEILVIDEADRMLDMGFIPDVRRIVSKLPEPGKRQTMLFSATLEPEILRLVERWLVNPVSVEAEPEKVVGDLIDQHFYAVSEANKIAFLVWLIQHEQFERMIIFGNWKHKNARIVAALESYGIDCGQLSGDIPQTKRIKILDKFKAGELKVVVATDVAARGIHVDGISHVINFDLPEQPEDYVHRIGRTGRAGHKGKSIAFVCEFGAYCVPAIEEYAGITVKTIQPEDQCFILPKKVRNVRPVEEEHSGYSRGGRSGGRRSPRSRR